MRRVLFLTGLSMIAAGGAAMAASDGLGNPVFGRRIADDFCSQCHIVAPEKEPGRGELGGRKVAPDLTQRVRDPGVTELALRTYLQTSHPRMPNIMLKQEETDDLIAYLLTLKERAP